MKKKILLVTHTLELGGVERSFISLLDQFDLERYDVDVFVYKHGGELADQLPPSINLLPEIPAYALLLQPISTALRTGKWGIAYAKIVSRIKSKLYHLTHKSDRDKQDSVVHPRLYKEAMPFLPKISDAKYDAVLAFLHPNFFERYKVIANKYIAWIHTDYSRLNIDRKLELLMWNSYDHIAGVSKGTVQAFAKVFPELKEKLTVVENVLSENFVRKQSIDFNVSEEMLKQNDELILLSIGRFSYPKNFDSIPEVAYHLAEMGVRFRWYIIGYGTDEALIRQKISEFRAEEYVVILGKKKNPYPYIRACDFYIQPSRYEGKAVTVREAQMLGKAVIITDFPSAESQIRNGIDGVIVPGADNLKLAHALYRAICDHDNVALIQENIALTDYSNKSEVETIYSLIEGE